ncbi:hypothetical protein [Streptomyces virginiae]
MWISQPWLPRQCSSWVAGVAFAADERTFYATMATGGRTHLARPG